MTAILPRASAGSPGADSAVLPAPGVVTTPYPAGRVGIGGHARFAARYGRTGLAPFLASSDVQVVDLLDGCGAAGYARWRRWAVTVGDVVAPAAIAEIALSQYLNALAERGLRPLFLAVGDPAPFACRGFAVTEIADEAVIDLRGFTLSGSARADVRHAVASAVRAGLAVVPYEPWQDGQLAEISREWLSTKRGGELGFTLSRHADIADQLRDGTTELWSVVDRAGRIQGWCTWRHYLGGSARVLDIMRRRNGAPNPAMDFLIATTLLGYRDSGVASASLACVPRDHGSLAERVYPRRSLLAYKQKFAPRWEARWLAVPHRWQHPVAMLAIGAAYCPGGLRRAIRHNH